MIRGILEEDQENIILSNSKVGKCFDVGLAVSDRKYYEIAFSIVDVPESKTLHVNQLALALPAIHDCYYFLTQCPDFNQRSFEEQPELEPVIIEECNKMIGIIDKLYDNILQATISEGDFILRQNSIREMGVINRLMDISELIQNKLESLDISGTDIYIQHDRSGRETPLSQINEIFQQYTSPALEVLKELLNRIYFLIFETISDNPANCQALDSHEEKLINRSKSNIKHIGKILQERFKYVGDDTVLNEQKFKVWYSRMRPICDRPLSNIREQILYFNIMTSLCEFNGKGVLKYQMLILQQLKDTANNFRIISFRQIRGVPCIEFDTQDKSLAEFLRDNHTLEGMRLAMDQTSVIPEGGPKAACFYLEDLCTSQEHCEYITVAINFISNIGLDRYRKGIRFVIDELGARLDHIEQVIGGIMYPSKVRAAYLNLCRSIFIDIDPMLRCSEHKGRCYVINAQDAVLAENYKEMSDEFKYMQEAREKLGNIIKVIRKFWSYKGLVVFEEEGLSQCLTLVIALMKVTKELIDFELVDEGFANYVLLPICLLIMEAKGSHQHWCSILTEKVRGQKSSQKFELRVSQMNEEALKILQVIIHRRQTLHLTRLIDLFRGYSGGGVNYMVDSSEVFSGILNQILSELDFDVEIRTQENESNIEVINYETQGSGEPLIEEIDEPEEGQGQHALNIYLLQLLFNVRKHKNKELKKKALDIIIQDLNTRSLLKKEMVQITFLLNDMSVQTYFKLIHFRTQIHLMVNILKQTLQEAEAIHDKASYIASLKDATYFTLEVEHSFLIANSDDTSFRKYQNMARHSGIHIQLIQILYLPAGQKLHSQLLKSAFTALYYFCLSNHLNQQYLFQHKDRILDLLGSKLGASRVLAVILSRHKTSQLSMDIVRLILDMIERNEYKYQLLHILKSFMIQENGELIPNMQINILKAIFQNVSIMNFHRTQAEEGSSYRNVNFIRPDIKPDDPNFDQLLKFHIEVMKCITTCAIDNKFGVMQCRKLITLPRLLDHIFNMKKDIPNVYNRKKIYLRFLYQVYMADVSDNTRAMFGITHLERLIEEVLIPDLRKYRESYEQIIDLARRGLYENIVSQHAQELRMRSLQRKINEMDAGDLPQIEVKEAVRSQDELVILQYWRYLSGGGKWHSEKDGLLHVIHDIFVNSPTPVSMSTTILIASLRTMLNDISDLFFQLEKQNSDLDFSKITEVINLCREALPIQSLQRAPQEQTDETELEKLMMLLKQYVIEHKVSLQEVFDEFDMNKNDDIDFEEFRKGVKNLLGDKITSAEIEKAFKLIDVDNGGTIEFREFAKPLRKHFSKHPHKVKRRRENGIDSKKSIKQGKETKEVMEDNNTSQMFAVFIDDFSQLAKDQDIKFLVKKVEKSFVQPALDKQNSESLISFISKLGTVFKKKHHKIYLIRILHKLIPRLENEDDLIFDPLYDSTSSEYIGGKQAQVMDRIKKIQNIFVDSGVFQMIVRIVKTETDFRLLHEAIILLKAMLQYGNAYVQEKTLQILKQDNDSPLFLYIRKQLRESRDRIVEISRRKFKSNYLTDLETDEMPMGYQIITTSLQSLADHVRDLVNIIQCFVENCYADFQSYLRVQTNIDDSVKSVNINLVSELAQFLVSISEASELFINDYECQQVIPQTLETLIDFCKGPCLENQLLLGRKRKLYKVINTILRESKDNKLSAQFRSSIRFLTALLEGDIQREIANLMIKEIDFKFLAQQAFEIYQYFIYPNQRRIMQEWIDYDSDNVQTDRLMRFMQVVNQNTKKNKGISPDIWKIAQIGFDIVIMSIRMKHIFKDNQDLHQLAFSERYKLKFNQMFIRRKVQGLGGWQESIFQSTSTALVKAAYKLAYCILRMPPKQVNINHAYMFYTSLISQVEVEKDGQLQVCYFQTPACMAYMNAALMKQVVHNVKRDTHEEKMKSFFIHTEKYTLHMTHLQYLTRFRTLSWFVSKQNSICNFNFLLVVFANLILLFTTEKRHDGTVEISSEDWKIVLTFLGVIICVLSILVYFLYIIQNYKILLYDIMNQGNDSALYDLKEFSRLRGSQLMKYFVYLSKIQGGQVGRMKNYMAFIYVILDTYNLINLAYVIIVMLAFQYPILYCILLLDVIRRVEELGNILEAITTNRYQLMLAVIFGCIIIYLFSIWGFLQLGEYYKTQEDGAQLNTYCQNLLDCFTSTLNIGIRAGGGIGEFLGKPLRSEEEYWSRQIFDIIFFIVISVILLNIIFGIIIDTFAQLRDLRKDIEKDIKTKCFICGIDKYEFELRGRGWTRHISTEHNLWAYLAYIIYIRRKPIQECDGIEKYVKDKIVKQRDPEGFFPKTAISLLSKYDEGTDEVDDIEKKLDVLEKSVQQMLTKH